MNAPHTNTHTKLGRHILRDEARRQKIAPSVLAYIEKNLEIADTLLDHLEKQERFLINEFLKSRPCVWCDSDVSWFEAIPPAEVEGFSLAKSTPETHECPHCQKRIVYTLPFMGGWFWRKHEDDKNPDRVRRDASNKAG